MSCIHLYLMEKVRFSIYCVNTSGLKLNSDQSAHCTVTSNVLTVTNENHNDVYFQSCQFMFRGLSLVSIGDAWNRMFFSYKVESFAHCPKFSRSFSEIGVISIHVSDIISCVM